MKQAVAKFFQALPKFAEIETITSRLCHGSECSGNTWAPYNCTDTRRLRRQFVQCLGTSVIKLADCANEQRACRESVFGEIDCGLNDLGQRHRSESLIECDPAIDTSGHGDHSNVMPKWHCCEALGTQLIGICPRTRSATAVECMHCMPIVNESEQVAAKAAEVRTGDGNGSVCCNGGINCVTPLAEDRISGTGSELVG